ncbi:beta-ketoacyl synthase chain length factor [Tamlana sp. 2201CG12-4]|uniref:beta-ketoacyl synthase chain length factor n=1 Tax=Tamlana sp. 2201CG12-4 TaxID=3112582 RepID=UPI002DBF32EF|nr:beta-ketoacyl synthase chain length factor [Tamlana sp. 2201CG12-4]MEC3906101.1 beta-ketoacyl synthase chain length factor [Tamlana sp. 2201CG12-4]
MKPCYINSVASISVQDTFDSNSLLETIISHKSKTAHAIHPKYKEFISPIASRRMATGVKMGIAASKVALQESQLDAPDAIITGTGMGCIEDSEKFLNAIIDNDEQYLTPTSFIQSTHNTVGAQIALTLKCKSYNVTYVHGSVSFESALVDAQLMLHENIANNILVGGVDELGKQFIQDIVMAEALEPKPITTAFGEGAHFFTLSSSKQKNSYCTLKAIEITNKATPQILKGKLHKFLKRNGLSASDIDAVLLGNNGDGYDNYYHNLQDSIFNATQQIHYKHVSGEFFTASAFGFWAATHIVKQQKIPKALLLNKTEKSNYKNVLLYNQFKGQQHSFILLTSC